MGRAAATSLAEVECSVELVRLAARVELEWDARRSALAVFVLY